jgi:aryl-alcohol dehydrogenase-like predicted oxidoreductase
LVIAKQKFGRTGHASSQIIFGSYALSHATQKAADEVLEILLEYGVNHIDTAPMYGSAEQCIGGWMKKYRDKFFIATKSRSRTYEGAWKNLHRSLERLKVDTIDLWQMHGLTNQGGWEKAMGPGGALEAFLEARSKGLVRYLGVTGHGNRVAGMHVQSLARFDFDAVMLLYNYRQMQIPKFATDFERLVKICKERNVAVGTFQSIARCPIGKGERKYNMYFYEPLESQEAIELSVHWAMGLEDSFVITPGDIQFIPQVLEAAARFDGRPSDEQMKSLVERYDIQPIFSA